MKTVSEGLTRLFTAVFLQVDDEDSSQEVSEATLGAPGREWARVVELGSRT